MASFTLPTAAIPEWAGYVSSLGIAYLFTLEQAPD